MNFQACLIFALGLTLSFKNQSDYRIAAISLIGIAGWLAFMAKPSTAMFLAGTTVLFLSINLKNQWRTLIGATIVSLLLLILSAYYIDGSIFQFIQRLRGGLLLLNVMDGGHGIGKLLRLDLFDVSPVFKLKITTLTLFIFASLYIAKSSHSYIKTFTLFIALFLLTFSAWYFTESDAVKVAPPRYHLLLISALPFATLLYAQFNRDKKHSNIQSGFILFLLVLPYLFAVGSGNNYWHTAAGASVFWVLAAMLIMAKNGCTKDQLSLIVAFTIAISIVGLRDALNIPYRQSESILEQRAEFLDPNTNEKLILAEDTAHYLTVIKTVVADSKFKAGTPVIDLTGFHPGTLYFMQAKSIGQAWNIGGYKGSELMASLALYQASCEEIASAWLLIEKEGRRQISHTILMNHGIRADKTTYQKIAKFDSQQLFKTHQKKVFQQYLLKPIDIQNQTNACLIHRKTTKNPFRGLNLDS